MRVQDITYLDKLNELRLDLSHPNSRGICFVLLEGETDIRLFRKLFNLGTCKVEKIPGGNAKVESAVSELLNIYEMIIGIRDADFIHLGSIPYSKTNMFLTDFHDIEMTILSEDDIISTIVFEFTDLLKENHNTIREKLISALEQISLLKWLNEIEKLEMVFDKTGFQDLISFVNSNIDFDQYFNRLLSKSPNAKILDINSIKLKISRLKALNPHPYQLCNGHDFIKTLSQFIRNQGKAKGINEEIISSILRINYSKEKFYSTNLFASTKAWADSKAFSIYS